METKNDKPAVIAKIVKLFLEFLIAAVVAWFGSSCCRKYVRPMVTHYVATSVHSQLL